MYFHQHHLINQGKLKKNSFFEFFCNNRNFYFSNSCIYTCQNGLLENYSEENVLSVPPNGLSQPDMVSSIHPMALDLYSLSITPPLGGCTSSPPPPPPPSIQTTSPVDTIPSSSLNKQDQNSPVIYPWMRKAHINNPG
jgi:hypothetical protein